MLTLDPFITIPTFPVNPLWGMVPVGTIISWAGNIPVTQVSGGPPAVFNPEDYGWLICDGRELQCAQYFTLYSVLGNLYGGSQGDTFKLPDFQGYFLRTVDPGKTIDKDPRTSQPNDTVGLAGTTQLSAVQTHTHTYTMPANQTPANVGANPPTTINVVQSVTPDTDTSAPFVTSSTSANSVLVSQNETRSVNIAVYNLIKAI